MKWFTFTLSILLFQTAFSQEKESKLRYQPGLTIGVNISSVERSQALTFTNMGVSAGIKGVLSIHKHLRIQHYITYNQKGYQLDETLLPTPGIEPNDVYTWDYIDFPILVGYEFDQKPFSFTPLIGIQQGWMLRAYHFEHEYLPGRIIRYETNLLEDPTASINRFEIGWLLGVNLTYPSKGSLTPFLDVRYTHATNKISKGQDAALSVSNRMLTFVAGVYF